MLMILVMGAAMMVTSTLAASGPDAGKQPAVTSDCACDYSSYGMYCDYYCAYEDGIIGDRSEALADGGCDIMLHLAGICDMKPDELAMARGSSNGEKQQAADRGPGCDCTTTIC